MSKKVISRVTVTGLSDALQATLDEYNYTVMQGVDGASYRAADKLLQLTRATAPEGVRRKFKSSIAIKEIYEERRKYSGRTYVWYVKPPHHRLTHLLVHGHETRDGGRTKPNSFLQDAIDQVAPEFMEDLEDALKWK